MSPLRVRLGWPQRLAVLRHIQDVGVQFRSHEQAPVWTMDARFASCKRGGRLSTGGEAEEERVEFGEAKEEERMTNGTAGSGTPHSSSCRFLYPGPTLENMEELIIDQGRKGEGKSWQWKFRNIKTNCLSQLLLIIIFLLRHTLNSQWRPLVSRFLFNSFLRSVSQTLWRFSL